MILVLASKKVGLECVKYLVKHKFNFDLVLCHEDVELKKYADALGLSYCFYQNNLKLQKKYTWLLNLWSPHILKKDFLDKFLYRLNIHPSYSPYCLGNDNAAWTIRNRYIAGVSLLEMTEKVDEGEIWVQEKVSYSYPIKGKELHELLLKQSIKIFCKYWSKIYAHELKPQKIELIDSKFCREDTNKDREIILSDEIEDFINKVLAHDFLPNNAAMVKLNGKKYKIEINLEELS